MIGQGAFLLEQLLANNGYDLPVFQHKGTIEPIFAVGGTCNHLGASGVRVLRNRRLVFFPYVVSDSEPNTERRDHTENYFKGYGHTGIISQLEAGQ